MFLQNNDISIKIHTALLPRRLTSVSSPPWEPHIAYIIVILLLAKSLITLLNVPELTCCLFLMGNDILPLFPQQRLPDCCHIQHFDFIFCWTCDLLCDWFPRTWATSGSEESGRPRSRSCFYCIPRSGGSASSLTPMVAPLLCNVAHPWARLAVRSHGDGNHCHIGSFP